MWKKVTSSLPSLTTLLALAGAFWGWYTWSAAQNEQAHQTHIGILERTNAARLDEVRRDDDKILAERGARYEQEIKQIQALAERDHELERLRRADSERALEDRFHAALLEANNRADTEAEKSRATIESLRAELSSARGSAQLRSNGGYVNITDLAIDESSARDITAHGGYVVSGPVICPDYGKHGWDVQNGIALAQVAEVMRKGMLQGVPTDYKKAIEEAGPIMWMPMVTVFRHKDQHGEAVVGFSTFTFGSFHSSMSFMDAVGKEAHKLVDSSVGLNFFMEVSAFSALGAPFSDWKDAQLSVKDFSASNDSCYMRIASNAGGFERTQEFMILRSGQRVLWGFSSYEAGDVLSPVRQEARDWLKQIRLIKSQETQN